MSTNSPLPVTADQRVLAAIVFTDVAGFSSRVERDETDTLALLERDFTTMRLFSAAHSGTVVKTTGDGLMIYFASAVSAVEWALKTQRHFVEQAAELPANAVLRHRIGIHLGDVFSSGGDLMGDGVNVAARVQAEARPGGICISQVVFGVVKNRLKLDVVPLEHRKLKNIQERVQMYHVLLEPPAQRPVQPTTAAASAAAEAEPAKSATLTRNLVIGGTIVMGIGVAGFFLLRAHRAHQQELVGSREMRDALGAALQTAPATPAQSPAPAPAATSGAVESKPTVVQVPVMPAAAGTTKAPEVNFLALTGKRPAAAGVSPEHDRALTEAAEAIRILDTWRAQALERYTRERPLLLRPLAASARHGQTVFSDATKQIYFREGGAEMKRGWSDLKPDVQATIVHSLLINSPTPPTLDVVRGAEAFAFVHGLPELAAVLVR